MRLLQDLINISMLSEAKEALHERAQVRLTNTAKELIARADEDAEVKHDIDVLVSLITSLKVLSKRDYREALRADDIGFNPNNARELLGALNKIPDSATVALPKEAADFIRAVSALAPSLKKVEAEKLEALKSHDLKARRGAERYLQQVAAKAGKMLMHIESDAR